MENTVPRKQRLLPEFSVNISSTIISGEMTRRTETEHKKGGERDWLTSLREQWEERKG